MYSDEKPMSQLPDYKIAPGDKKRVKKKWYTGGEVEITNFADGSSIVHHGGPCGDAHYDQYGEEV